MGKEQLEQLKKYGSYLISPKGISMRPMLRPKKDIVEIHELNHPARRYDLVMYTRGAKQQGVIHRVHRVRENDYVIVGDNCWKKEFVPHEAVAGIVTRFCRNGKWIGSDNLWYLVYVHLWTDFFFIRGPILFLRDFAKRAIGKILRILKIK